MPSAKRVCKNATLGTPHAKRDAPNPGPRCATCHREHRAAARAAAKDAHVLRFYRLTAEEYAALYEAQGGRCAICQRARGTTRRLAVDHDHKCCAGPVTCGKCVRGLLCKSCNRMLGHFRDDPEAFERAAQYLRRPPAHAVLLGVD
jgi:hypothetical protein